MLNYLKTIKFRLSDLFFLLFGIMGSLLCIESNYLMTIPNPITTRIPFWACVCFFIVLLLAFAIYMCLETKRNGLGKKEYFCICAMVTAIVVGLIAIFSTNNNITIVIKDLNDDLYSITTSITNEVKAIHSFALLFLILCVSSLIIHFSKRIDDIRFISFSIYVFYLVSFGLFIYSLFKDDYITFFKMAFSGKPFKDRIEEIAPFGAFGNKNVYGKFLELGLFVSLINYSLTNKKHNLLFGLLFYVHLLITICKVGILCATIVLFLYILVNFALSLFDKRKGNILFFSIVLTSVIFTIGIIAILINTNSAINNLYVYFTTHLHSLVSRNDLWSYSMQINNSTSFIFGAGYGVFNSILLNACSTIMEEPLWSSHSFFFTLMGRNGVLYVSFYLILVAYSFYLAIKLLPKNKYLVISTLCLELSFFLHSCFEDYYDMVFLSIMLLMIYTNVSKTNSLYIENEKLLI